MLEGNSRDYEIIPRELVIEQTHDTLDRNIRFGLVDSLLDGKHVNLCKKLVSHDTFQLGVLGVFDDYYQAGKCFLQLQNTITTRLREAIEELADSYEGWPYAHLMRMHIAVKIDRSPRAAILAAAQAINQYRETEDFDKDVHLYSQYIAKQNYTKCVGLTRMLREIELDVKKNN